jgi:hypothetical protein
LCYPKFGEFFPKEKRKEKETKINIVEVSLRKIKIS